MSTEDADAYIDGAVAHALGGRSALVVDDVVIFVDYHEANSRVGVSFAAALDSVEVKDASFARVRAHLETGDIIVARVVARDAVTDAARTLLDANVTLSVSGLKPSVLLANPTTTALAAVIVYERKTIMDLVASIRRTSVVPGAQHMASQVERLKALRATTNARVRLLLEGYMANALTRQPVGSMNEDGLHSYINRLDLIDGISTVQSADTGDSARTVLKEARFVARYKILPADWMYLPRDVAETLVSVRKSENADERVYYLSVLQAILAISPQRATAIAAVFPDIVSLVDGLRAAPSDKARRALVADIVVGGRRLGKALADRVIARYYRRPTTAMSQVTTPPTTPAEPAVPPAAPKRPMRDAKRKALETPLEPPPADAADLSADDSDFSAESSSSESEEESSSSDSEDDAHPAKRILSSAK